MTTELFFPKPKYSFPLQYSSIFCVDFHKIQRFYYLRSDSLLQNIEPFFSFELFERFLRGKTQTSCHTSVRA